MTRAFPAGTALGKPPGDRSLAPPAVGARHPAQAADLLEKARQEGRLTAEDSEPCKTGYT